MKKNNVRIKVYFDDVNESTFYLTKEITKALQSGRIVTFDFSHPEYAFLFKARINTEEETKKKMEN